MSQTGTSCASVSRPRPDLTPTRWLNRRVGALPRRCRLVLSLRFRSASWADGSPPAARRGVGASPGGGQRRGGRRGQGSSGARPRGSVCVGEERRARIVTKSAQIAATAVATLPGLGGRGVGLPSLRARPKGRPAGRQDARPRAARSGVERPQLATRPPSQAPSSSPQLWQRPSLAETLAVSASRVVAAASAPGRVLAGLAVRPGGAVAAAGRPVHAGSARRVRGCRERYRGG